MNEERPDRYYINDNLQDKRHFFHIPDRNLGETAVAEVVIFSVIKAIPGDLTVKIIAGVLIMLTVGVVGLVGIKNESVTEFIGTIAKYQKKKHTLHYRRCDQRNYDKNGQTEKTGERKESRAEELVKKIEEGALRRIEEKINEKNKQ